jgi:hypothetical protein
MKIQRKLKIGDYVVATKYNDGSPNDHWAVGFFAGMTTHTIPRFEVCDETGLLFRNNGFRRAQRITAKRGLWLLQNSREIENSDRCVWHFVKCRML